MVLAMRTIACLALAVLVAACGPKDTDPGPGGVTVAEAKALDDAAQMLDQRRLPAAATQDEAAAPAIGASPAAPSPPPSGSPGA
jgi:hypothetical protein